MPILRVGQQIVTKGVYVFECPVCQKVFRYDDRYEPMCTGPSEMRDEHVPTVMVYLRTEPRQVAV